LAREVAQGRLSLAPAAAGEETRERLRAIPGLGPWTEAYIAMRALRDPDAFPAGDLVLRKMMASNGALPSAEEVLRRAESWRPWRAYAVLHLWTAEPADNGVKTRRTHAHSN
jgi:AraC family transcriptional regulator of adaptative response / DNA-3-methyladenine glycosylase II